MISVKSTHSSVMKDKATVIEKQDMRRLLETGNEERNIGYEGV